MTDHQIRVRTETGWQDLIIAGPPGPPGAPGAPGVGILLIEHGATVPPDTPVGTVIVEKA